jgi:hypothetical protein
MQDVAEYFGSFSAKDSGEVPQAQSNQVLQFLLLIFLFFLHLLRQFLVILDLIEFGSLKRIMLDGKDGLMIAGILDAADLDPLFGRLLEDVLELLHA